MEVLPEVIAKTWRYLQTVAQGPRKVLNITPRSFRFPIDGQSSSETRLLENSACCSAFACLYMARASRKRSQSSRTRRRGLVASRTLSDSSESSTSGKERIPSADDESPEETAGHSAPIDSGDVGNRRTGLPDDLGGADNLYEEDDDEYNAVNDLLDGSGNEDADEDEQDLQEMSDVDGSAESGADSGDDVLDDPEDDDGEAADEPSQLTSGEIACLTRNLPAWSMATLTERKALKQVLVSQFLGDRVLATEDPLYRDSMGNVSGVMLIRVHLLITLQKISTWFARHTQRRA